MKFLCLIYQNEAEIDAMPAAEYEAIVADVLAYREVLKQSSHYITSSPLEPISASRTVRVRDGRATVTDGPFAETKEQVGGFYLIEAADFDEAVRLAAHMPPARIATIEVRPLKDFTPK